MLNTQLKLNLKFFFTINNIQILRLTAKNGAKNIKQNKKSPFDLYLKMPSIHFSAEM